MSDNHTYIQTIICHQCTYFFPKTFLQNNQCNYKFSQKEYFFDTNWRNDIFWYGKKYTIFVQKLITQKIFKIQKNFCSMKKFRILAFQWYKIFHSNSRNDRDMIKWKKSFLRVATFFLVGCLTKTILKCFDKGSEKRFSKIHEVNS